MTDAQILATIDLAVLGPNDGLDAVRTCCDLVAEFGCATACVKPCHVDFAVENYPNLPISTVIGYPHGNTFGSVDTMEAALALNGACELDMVMNIADLRDRKHRVADTIANVAQLCHSNDATLKIILETCYLTPIEIIVACAIAMDGMADFVKTSTGYGPRGAEQTSVQLMLDAVQGRIGVKASGGLSTLTDCRAFLNQGCLRLGVGYTKLRGMVNV